MSETTVEYRVAWGRFGDVYINEFKTREKAERYIEAFASSSTWPVDYMRLESRTVTPWSPVEDE